jgi:hypothetical protein
MTRRIGPRDQRGVALPSPVVLLSVVAVLMAVVAFVLTGGKHDAEREITPAADTPTPSAAAHPHVNRAGHHHPKKPKAPQIDRGKVFVEVYNNTNIHGLAGSVAAKAATIGWDVVGADNWMGTVPATTVYYPAKLEAAGKKLALDLGIKRTHLAEAGSMKPDRLTIIVTAPLS